jgi:NAD+ synthase (glutamine-hydrolysing)
VSAPFGFLRVAAACPEVAVADPAANVAHLLRAIREAESREAQVLVLPELALTGYTCADLFFSRATLVAGAAAALGTLLARSRRSALVFAVGLPLVVEGRLFNVAAVCQGGAVLGFVPKSYLPGYKEFYEERWFRPAREATAERVDFGGASVPFGDDLVFERPGEDGLALAVEICEDLWAPVPPSSRLALAGATVILCPSASDDLVGKAEWRRELVRQQSGRTLTAYAYANCGVHESTTDLVFGGHLLVAENGVLLAEGERFRRRLELVVTDVDVERLVVERLRQTTFADGVNDLQRAHRKVALGPMPPPRRKRLVRAIDPHPFVPGDAADLDARCREIVSIQAAGLARRLEHAAVVRPVLGLSGGLDSTLALLVTAQAQDLLGRPRERILAVTMPGFGTTRRTLENARALAAAARAELREIDIRPACTQHLRDIGLDPADRSSAFENVQARERTQVLMDLANMERGLVVGTGDLSELALGFCTFAGDHIAMYNVNAGVPKTLVRRLVQWVAAHLATDAERRTLDAVLATPVSPELLPPGPDGAISQRTEDIVGPYELHDFFLFGFLRLGAGPAKLLFLAEHAFAGRYDRATLVRWLRVFLERFFTHQFKRSTAPDGPKVGSVSLSPRGDWRMPSDARKEAFLAELAAAAGRGPARPRRPSRPPRRRR